MRHLFAMAEVARLKRKAEAEVRIVSIPGDWSPPVAGTFVKETMRLATAAIANREHKTLIDFMKFIDKLLSYESDKKGMDREKGIAVSKPYRSLGRLPFLKLS